VVFRKTQINLTNRVIGSFLLLFAALNSYSQNIPLCIKKEFLNINKQILRDTVNKLTVIEYPFVVGRYHRPVANKVIHPYFKNNEWVNGTIVFKGRNYEAEGLKFDIENDKLIYLMYTQDYMMNCIALDENFISGFSISNSTFKYYNWLKNNRGCRQKDGYYEVVFDGNLKFLVRWEKSLSISNISASIKYNVTNEMFLLKNNKVKRVHSMTKLRRQLKDKKKDIKKYVGDNNLKLNRSHYSSAAKVLKFYEGL
jgi:hypothetical protein